MANRKCLECGEWNKDLDYCSNCNSPISAEAQSKAWTEQVQKEDAEKPKDKFDLFLERVSVHKNPLVRWTYLFFYSLWSIFAALLAFLLWATVGTNG